MKKLLIVALLLAACEKNPTPGPGPTPPGPIPPDPTVSFEIQGEKILVQAVMKPDAKVSLAEMKASLLTAVKQLELKGD